MSSNCLYHPPRVVGGLRSKAALDQNVLMVAGAYLGAEVLVEVLIIGLNHPLLMDEGSALFVLHPVVAAIDAACQPSLTNVVHILFEVDHWLLLPSHTWVWPLEVDLRLLIRLQDVLD